MSDADKQALLDGSATIQTEIVVHNENLFDKNNAVLINGTVNTGDNTITDASLNRTTYIPCEPNTTYTISKRNNGDTNRFAVATSVNLPAIGVSTYQGVRNDNANSITITTNSTANYLVFFFYRTQETLITLEEMLDSIRIEEGTPTILTEDNSVISWNHEDFRYVKGQGWIGQFVARQLTGELKNVSNDFSITDKEIVLRLGVKVNNTLTWYSLGTFLVTKVSDDEVKDKISFEALDYTKRFNKLYEDRVTYPCTAQDLAIDVCNQCGVELATTTFTNYDYVIDGNVFKNNETCRDVMKAIGKLAFSWVRIDWDDRVYLDFTKSTVVGTYDVANNSKYYNLTTQSKSTFGPVNRVVIGYSQIEGERTKIEDSQTIDDGVWELTIYDNPLVYTQEQRESIINSASYLFGLTYTPLNMLTIGHPWLKGYELFAVTDMENNVHNTIPFDRTIQYFGHIKTLIDSAIQTQADKNLSYEPDIGKGLMQTEIQVNKNTGDITSLTARTATLEDEMGNVYTIEQTNELVQNAATGVTNTFSEAGGNNVFRNTGLWFESDDSNNPYEFWNGLVVKYQESAATNMTALMLQNNILYQEQLVSNGNYTISFKYKKLIALANCKCVINDVEYVLNNMTETEFVQTIAVTSQYINIQFITDIDNACEIYDVMVNAGQVKLAYSQNQNETTTDTVNISKGITITSSNTDTTFKANADGIRTLDKHDNVLTEFTDTGMTTKKQTVTDEALIVGVLIQEVGNQTWFTRL